MYQKSVYQSLFEELYQSSKPIDTNILGIINPEFLKLISTMNYIIEKQHAMTAENIYKFSHDPAVLVMFMEFLNRTDCTKLN